MKIEIGKVYEGECSGAFYIPLAKNPTGHSGLLLNKDWTLREVFLYKNGFWNLESFTLKEFDFKFFSEPNPPKVKPLPDSIEKLLPEFGCHESKARKLVEAILEIKMETK